jgi:hypothetical protein
MKNKPKSSREPLRFDRTLAVRCPPALAEAVRRAAASRCALASNYVRDAIVRQLKADGYDLATPQSA